MWLLIGLFVLSVVWYYRRVKKMSLLSRSGIPGPKPHLIYGNMYDMKGLPIVEKHKRLIQKYGKIVGYYRGGKPIILVADPQLVKDIQVKNFEKFTDRSDYLRYFHSHSRNGGALNIARGQNWQKNRRLISVAFSSAKLKKLTPNMDVAINSFLSIIEEKVETGEEFDMHDLYNGLTLELMIKSVFGNDVYKQNSIEKKLLMESLEKYHKLKINRVMLLMADCFPELEDIILYLRGIAELVYTKFMSNAIGILWWVSAHIVSVRKQYPGHRPNDLLQAMFDSEIGEDVVNDLTADSLKSMKNENSGVIQKDNVIKPLKSDKKNIRLTEDEIIANCILFLIGGLDTTSHALVYITHFLVNYPEVQQKVRQEIKELYESEGKLDYNTVTDLQYLKCVMKEALRHYPPNVNGTTRICLADYKYKDMTIPKGATIVIATHYMHRDPDYWTDPEKFDPMRFSPEQKKYRTSGTWQVFGGGPRSCMGFRLIFLKMKLTLAKLLLNYKLVPGPNTMTEDVIDTRDKLLSRGPKNKVYMRAVKA